MGKIDSDLLLLEASLEMYGSVSYFNRVQKKQGSIGLPLWQKILMEGTHAQIKTFLLQIQLLDKDEQLDLLLCLSSDSITFSEHIAAYSNEDSLSVFFNLMGHFSREEQRMILLEANFSQTCFMQCLALNKEGGAALRPFFDFINAMDVPDRIKIFQKKITRDATLPLLLARNQTSILNNGLDHFVESWVKLKSQLSADKPTITTEHLCLEIFGNKKTAKAFYQDICLHQNSILLFDLFDNELIPKRHFHYFNKEKKTVWDVVLSLPSTIQRSVLYDALYGKSLIGKFFLEDKRLMAHFKNKQWKHLFLDAYAELSMITETMPFYQSSYHMIGEVITPMAAAVVVAACDDASDFKVPSAPSYEATYSMCNNKENENVAMGRAFA